MGGLPCLGSMYWLYRWLLRFGWFKTSWKQTLKSFQLVADLVASTQGHACLSKCPCILEVTYWVKVMDHALQVNLQLWIEKGSNASKRCCPLVRSVTPPWPEATWNRFLHPWMLSLGDAAVDASSLALMIEEGRVHSNQQDEGPHVKESINQTTGTVYKEQWRRKFLVSNFFAWTLIMLLSFPFFIFCFSSQGGNRLSTQCLSSNAESTKCSSPRC